MAKMTVKVNVNDLHFQYQPSVTQDACLVQIWWFQLKSVTSYRADKVKFTDRQADGRTDRRTYAGNDNTPSVWKAKGNQKLLAPKNYFQQSSFISTNTRYGHMIFMFKRELNLYILYIYTYIYMDSNFRPCNNIMKIYWTRVRRNIRDLVRDCSNSIANTMELLQPCTTPSISCSITLSCFMY